MSEQHNNPPIFQFFATPFYKVLAGHEQERSALRAFLLTRENERYANPSRPQSAHSAVFESRFDLLAWQDQSIALIKNRLYGHLMNYLADINGFGEQELQQLSFRAESWFHITRRGGFFQPHTHPLASVSLIYCVDPGDSQVANTHEAGQVRFTDPRYNASMYLDPANRHMRRDFSFDGIRFRLQPDEICIFPSYLQHSVEPYVGEQPRITIAANFSFGHK